MEFETLILEEHPSWNKRYSDGSNNDIHGHKCFKRNDNQGIWNHIIAWYLLPLHLFVSVTFAYTMMFVLDNKIFAIRSNPNLNAPHQKGLYQSQVTTLVSVSLVCIRIIAGAWSSLSVWRCCFILLEKSGLTLQQLSSTIAFNIPTSAFASASKGKGQRNRGATWIVFMICALLLPSQFAAPIASGSISWIPDIEMSPVATTLNNISVAGPGYPWDWYQEGAAQRNTLVLRSAAYASSVQINPNRPSLMTWRGVPSLRDAAVNTIIGNITVPYFDIQGWEWVQHLSDLPDGMEDIVTGEGSLNISSVNNPIQPAIEGNAVILKKDPWQQQTYRATNNGLSFSYPDPKIVSTQQYAAVLVQRIPGYKCQSTSNTFGDLPVPPSGQLIINYTNAHCNCYMFARFNLIAGSAVCQGCNVSSLSTVSPSQNPTSNLTVSPDKLVMEIISMMPEVMYTIASMNATETSQFGNIDQWTQALLVDAYSATWTVMSQNFADPSLSLSSQQNAPVQVVRASILRWRMWLWLGLNGLVTVSGLVLIALQANCKRKPVVDTVLAAVMLDPQMVLKEDRTGLCNASRLAGVDESVGVLKLARFEDGSGEGHFLLDKVLKT